MEHVASFFAIHPYRCDSCKLRFLRFKYAPSFPATSAENEVRTTRRAYKWKMKRRELLLYGIGFLLFMAFLYFITRDRGSTDS